ncbi:Rqc2 family fibronectin-binding protein [Hippea maritima]|uniref:Fibronectin-binding A domain protein n=1 Tax=Hippea maritima (strain ATCC 700847 / DSM 10411 / MH2) TaxID=760142 RepID=F2LTH5_HIPMA|nr:NFACT family protein [Hippea maritima]AEA33300.1 Fibronectin-binding A domain protein [Hippea maritima DSM 10411]
MNHYLFKYAIELSKKIFINKRLKQIDFHPLGIFSISFFDEKHRLFFSLLPQNSFLMPFDRVLGETVKDELNFFVSLRKRLKGLKLVNIEQNYSERVAYFIFEDKRGLMVSKFKLVFEIMGRNSNLVLLNGNDMVLQAYKYLDNSRQLLSKKPYSPPVSDMPDVLRDDIKKLLLRFKHSEDILGFPLNLRRMIKNDNEFLAFIRTVREAFDKGEFELYLYPKNEVYPFYLPYAIRKLDVSFLYELFVIRPQRIRFENLKSNLKKVFTRRLGSLNRRLKKVEDELKRAENYEKYRIYAENLFAKPNLDVGYRNFIELEDLYTKKPLKIPLNPNLNLFDNAQNYYKKYKKAKHSVSIVKDRLKETLMEIDFLNQLIFDLENATTMDDFEDVKEIASKEGVVKLYTKGRKKTKKDYLPYEHINIDGYDVYIGKNARGNDIVSLKLASKDDLWFHAKNIASAHLILKTPSKLQDIDDDVKMKIARIVACRSKAKKSEMVDVDYTLAKYVRKPKHAKMGMVIYTNFKTIRVKKDECS